MTTSQPTSFLSEILSAGRIPVGKLAYFRARLSNRLHEIVLMVFAKLEQEGKINKAELARRIGRKPEQVTRWLGAPGNWTIETVSDLLLGMGYEPALSVTDLSNTQNAPLAETVNVASHWPSQSGGFPVTTQISGFQVTGMSTAAFALGPGIMITGVSSFHYPGSMAIAASNMQEMGIPDYLTTVFLNQQQPSVWQGQESMRKTNPILVGQLQP